MQLSAVTRAATRPAAFSSSRVAPRVQHASTVCRARSDAFMVEVEVGDEEPEDVAVRRYMKLVMQSRVLENLRARRVRETKIEAYKRRFRERVEMRKAGVVEPTYDELYSVTDAGPFNDYFQRASAPNDPDYGWADSLGADLGPFGNYTGEFPANGGYPAGEAGQWGAYADPALYPASAPPQGQSWQGGYMAN